MIDHYRYVDVPGLRFIPSMGDVVGRRIRRHGHFRWLATPLIVMPVLAMIDMWGSTYATMWQVLSIVGLGIVVVFGLSLFWILGPDEKVVVGPAQLGMYLYPTHLILWQPFPDEPYVRLIIKREQVLRFYRHSTGSGNGPRLMVEVRRSHGELANLRAGLVDGSKREHTWLEHWRQTGSLTH